MLFLMTVAIFLQSAQGFVNFEDGHDYHYSYTADSNLFDVQNVTTIVKLRIRRLNKTDDGNLNQLFVESVFQRTEQGYASYNPLNWVLSRPFLFHHDDSGEIKFVHYHKEDVDEVVSLKKAVTSIFSVHVQEEKKKNLWTYKYNDTDHSGTREHQYFVQRLHDNAIHLRRYHNSITDVERHYHKQLNLSPEKEVKDATTEDKIALQKVPEPPARKPHPGEYTFEGTSDREFPKIQSASTVKVVLHSKVRHGEQPSVHHGLKHDSIVVKQSPPKKLPLENIAENITTSLECIRGIQNKFAPARTECVHKLKEFFDRLSPEDVTKLVEDKLKEQCVANDTVCVDERYLYIDVLCHLGTPGAQLLLYKYVINVKQPDTEELRRILFLYSALKEPTSVTIDAVWSICFGPHKEKHGTHNNTKITHNACLTLGALAKTLSATNRTVSTRIVIGLSTWLGHHDGSKVELAAIRIRRDVIPRQSEAEKNFTLTKMVLIEALGNTGHERALDHILSYTRSNIGHSSWRRSGISALRWYQCKKSAAALLDFIVNDYHDTVRDNAYHMYSMHPHRKNMTEVETNMILAKQYTYPAVLHSRSKRALPSLHFKLQLPGIDWSQTIGSSAVGASFGLVIRNILELRLGPLSGYFEVDIYNTAFVKGLLGVVGVEFDIMRALACYQGHIKYDLNVLKDFGINDITELADFFDKILAQVRDPVVDAIAKFKSLINTIKGKGVEGFIGDLVNIVRGFPDKLKTLVGKIKEFIKTVSDYEGLPWVKSIKKVFYRVKNFVEDVQGDIMNFYNAIIDVVTVTLPYVIRSIIDAINDAVKSIDSLFTTPLQSIQRIGKSVLSIKMAISMAFGAKKKIEEACFFKSGKLPYWMNLGTELKDLITDIKTAVTDVTEFIKRLGKNIRKPVELRVGPGDGLMTMEEQEIEIANQFITMLKETLSPMDELKVIAKPFIDAYNSVFDVITGVQKAYFDVKSLVEKSRMLVQKIFGPKFNIKFPVFKVDCDKSDCACGLFPSTVNDKYQPGIDLSASKGKKIVNPVVGLVKKRSNTEVIIIPATGAFEDYELILSNVIPISSITTSGAVIKAGDEIGKVGTAPCDPSFIHVAMRKKPKGNKPKTDAEYSYVDPAPYTERVVPIPRWIEECNEYSLTFLGATIEKGKTVGGGKNKRNKVKRSLKNLKLPPAPFKEPLPRDIDAKYRPPNVDLATTNTFKESFQKFTDVFKDIKKLFDKSSDSPSIYDVLNVNKYKISQLLHILGDTATNAAKKAQLLDLVTKLANYIRDQPIQHPNNFTPRRLRYLLQRRSLADTGTFEDMVQRYIKFPSGVCPSIEPGVGEGSGLFCSPHSDCLGVLCGVVFRLQYFVKVVKLDVRLNKCKNTLDVLFGEYQDSFALADDTHDIEIPNFGFGEMGASGSLTIKISGNNVSVTLEAELCSTTYPTCAPTVNIFNDIVFIKPNTPCLSGPTTDSIEDQVKSMELEIFSEECLEAAVGNRNDLLQFLNELRTATLDALVANPELFLELLGTSFPDKTDFCVDGAIPLKPLDATFFKYSMMYIIGPVPVRFQFGAAGSVGLSLTAGFCMLSMEARVTTTPFAGVKAWGSAAVSIGVASAGVEVIGYLLETQFPITGKIKFTKFPIDVGIVIQLVLVPIRLELRAFLEIELLFYTKKMSFLIWQYTAPSIVKTILDKPLIEKDDSPPSTGSPITGKRRRAVGQGCFVEQVVGRSPDEPAFQLEVDAKDEVSEVHRRYAVGSFKGGNDVKDWDDMGGPSILVPIVLRNGIPVFWTVKITNSQGLSTTAQCSLNTYDTTLPDGRITAFYPVSSHPRKMAATAVLREDSPITETVQGLGVAVEELGNSVVDWTAFSTKQATVNPGISSDLKHFSKARRGKLTTVNPIKTMSTFTDVHCATACLAQGSICISFDYDTTSQTCLLHSVIEGNVAQLRESGAFHNYERLTGSASVINFDTDSLKHGDVYFANVRVTNSLEYIGYMASEGTIVDFSPPEPGPISNASLDTVTADGCNAAVTQVNRCVDVTNQPNHRKIIDGEGSKTIFNGHVHLFDQKYTRNNHYVSANWDGFRDNETGIYGYTWAVGKSPCGTDVDPYDDPHAHLAGIAFWTHNGLVDGLLLKDGPVYVSVQGLNNVIYGGAFVTTVCHTAPLTIDTTPPDIHSIGPFTYDEDFDFLLCFYNVSDSLSGIARIDFGLGLTKYDVKLRPYHEFNHVEKEKTNIVTEQIGLKDGVAAWIRMRPLNHVDLFSAGHSPYPIMIDRTPPTPGVVNDGKAVHNVDIKYQSDNTMLCGFWKDFYDKDSGIGSYEVFFGEHPAPNSSVNSTSVNHNTKSFCEQRPLQHNTMYYLTVTAYNRGIDKKSVKATSDGVLIDTTAPVKGWAKDGLVQGKDVEFTHKEAEASAYYGGFADPESGIARYDITVIVNDVPGGTFDNGQILTFERHTFAFQTGDRVKVKVDARNGAESVTSTTTNGYTVDLTPPSLNYLRDNANGNKYQTKSDVLYAKWSFSDPESGITEYRLSMYMDYHGTKTRAWPKSEGEENLFPSSATQVFDLSRSLVLQNGARYTVKVTAINKAQLSTTVESDGIIVDTTPPTMVGSVIIGLTADDENIDVDGSVIVVENRNILASWLARDEQSGIASYLVGIGTSPGDTSVTGGFKDFGTKTHGRITGLNLQVTAVSGIKYYVTVKAKNGAGAVSTTTITSKPIKVLKGNVPGVAYDGRELFIDESVQNDAASLAMSFQGFESEACNIVTYQWAIGTKSGFSDIQDFTSYGLVLSNKTHGFAQANVDLNNGAQYYTTIRAVTGHRCHEKFIVSGTDGILVDSKAPSIEITQVAEHPVVSDKPLYRSETDNIEYRWKIVEKESSVAQTSYRYGSLPYLADYRNLTVAQDNFVPVGELSLSNSLTGFLTVESTDAATNWASAMSPSLTIDTTPPRILSFTCSPYTAPTMPVVMCEWKMNEKESFINSVKIGVGKKEGTDDLVPSSFVSVSKNTWKLNINPILKSLANGYIYVRLDVVNHLNMSAWRPAKVQVDITPPTKGTVSIVTGSSSGAAKCQVSQTFVDVEVTGFSDGETGIDRLEAAVGTAPGKEDVKSFHNVGTSSKFAIGNLAINAGSRVYVTVKAYNKVGMVAEAHSSYVIVSPNPKLRVNDGKTSTDIDYQVSLSEIDAFWQLEGGCELKEARWAIYRIDGLVMQSFKEFPFDFSNLNDDSLKLENDKTYYVIVELVDIIERKFIAKSDGVEISIESPEPGVVVEGLVGDVEYQQSSSEIHARWKDFGRRTNKTLRPNPSQTIVKYEVALGDDKATVARRQNIHPFVEVGLNTQHTFTGLSLTPKKVKYFVTVRATSKAGSTVTVSSNGIFVGYNDPVIPGVVTVLKAQKNTDSIQVAWTAFGSELDIRRYDVAVSSKEPTYTQPCTFSNETGLYDIAPLTSVGTDTVKKFEGLSLKHGHTYYATVRAFDLAGNCKRSTSNSLIVDLTDPVSGTITVGTQTADLLAYVSTFDSMFVQWHGFSDPESGIASFGLSLYQQTKCPNRTFDEKHVSLIYPEVKVQNNSKILFEDLKLAILTPYFVKVVATNHAGLKIQKWSLPIFVDNTPPIPGNIHYEKWEKSIYFQTSLTTIKTVYGVDHAGVSDKCPSQVPYTLIKTGQISALITAYNTIPAQSSSKPSVYYNDANVGVSNDAIAMKAKTINQHLHISGIGFQQDTNEGNYSGILKGVTGKEMVTTFVLTEEADISKFSKFDLPIVGAVPKDSDLKVANLSVNATGGGDQKKTILKENVSFNSSLSQKNIPKFQPTIGVHFPGFDINGTYQVMFFAVGKEDEIKRQWAQIDFNPSTSTFDFKITVEVDSTTGVDTWNSRLLIANKERATLYGIKKPHKTTCQVRIWSRNNYIPSTPPDYVSEALFKTFNVALPKTKACMFGKAFYDKESKIKQMWMGIGSKNNGVTDVLPLKLVDRPCAPCKSDCDFTCDPACNPNDFNLYPITLSGLSLSSGEKKAVQGLNINETQYYFQPSVYFVVAKAINYVGESATVIANGITVDITPPKFDILFCLDPSKSMTEPIDYLGSNKTFGAYWECFEDASVVVSYTVSVGTSHGIDDVYSWNNVKLDNRIRLNAFKVPLVHNTKYFFNIRALNSAGLTSLISCNVTTDYNPPDVTNIGVKAMGTKSDPRLPAKVLATNDPTSASLEWKGGSSDVLFYELSIETDGGTLLPPVLVGLSTTTKVEIKDGKLIFQGTQTQSLSVHGNKNYSKNIEQVKKDTFFRLEPGQCATYTLYAMSKAKVRTVVASKRICVLRDQDTVADLRNNKTNYIGIGGTGGTSASPDPNAVKNSTIKVNINGNDPVIAGKLDDKELKQQHGSAASATYTSYVQDPESANGIVVPVSDRLKDRFVKYAGPSFFMAPAGLAVILNGPIEIEVKFDPANFNISAGQIPVLIYFDPGANTWREACESCNSCVDTNPYLNIDFSKNVLKVKICSTRTKKNATAEVQTDVTTVPTIQRRRRRATNEGAKTFPLDPTMFAMISGKSKISEVKKEEGGEKGGVKVVACNYFNGTRVPGSYHKKGSRWNLYSPGLMFERDFDDWDNGDKDDYDHDYDKDYDNDRDQCLYDFDYDKDGYDNRLPVNWPMPPTTPMTTRPTRPPRQPKPKKRPKKKKVPTATLR